jgi:predicted peptidase
MVFKFQFLLGLGRLIFLILLFSNSLEKIQAQKFDSCYFKKDTAVLPYLLLKPLHFDSSLNYPLLVFLHGSGSRGHDNQNTAAHIDSLLLADSNRVTFPAYVVVPQCENDHKWVDADWNALSHEQPAQPSTYMGLCMRLLDSLESVLNIDKKRIYVTGLSMGGFGTWDLIARLPNKFAAAAPVCGGGDPKTASLIAHIPIWCFHGSEDKVVKVSRSRNMYEALLKENSKIKYSEYKGVGHGSWKQAYAEPDFLKWMFAQKLK